MRLVVFLAVILMLAASEPGKAQPRLSIPPNPDLGKANGPLIRVADRATIKRRLDLARTQYKNTCRWTLWRSQRRCRAIRSQINRLQRELTYAGRSGGGSGEFAGYGRGTFRTICVRVCDGYYYSLSHTGSRRRFQQDAERCKGQYPPGEAVLFYHPFPGDDVSRARTLDGKRYADQEYAFAYRSTFMPQCAAQLQQGLAALRERVYAAIPSLIGEGAELAADWATAEPGAGFEVPIPIARNDRSIDPETAANRRGGLMPEVVEIRDEVAMRVVADPHYLEAGNPGPPATVAGYQPPELVDFRLKSKAWAVEATERSSRQEGDAPLSGSYCPCRGRQRRPFGRAWAPA